MGKTALITGAGGGIGSAVSRRFLREGYRLILVDKDRAALATLAGEAQTETIVADLTNENALGALRAAVDSLSEGLSAAVFCHGGCQVDGKPWPDLSYWETNHRQNTIASVNAFSACANGLRKSRGSLVITSSVDAFLSLQGAGPYDASKAAQASLARSISRAYAPEVCAIALLLGTVRTAAWAPSSKSDVSELDLRANENLAGQIITPEEVGGLAWLLCQQEARIMRGQSVVADNGWSFLAGTFRFDQHRQGPQ